MPSKQVYLILGAAGSGRREVLADLVSDCLDRQETVATFLSSGEAASEHDSKLGRLERWTWTADHRVEIDLPEESSAVFFMVDGAHNPVDQIEAFRAWLSTSGAELARIFCIVDCQLVHRQPPLLAWYDACIHFADVVLLNHRQGVPNKWMSDFVDHYRSKHYPCLVEFVKDGKVKNPPLLLLPQARRMSLAFDEDAVILPEGVIFVDETEDEDEDDEDGERSPDDGDELPTEDPYFQRRLGGRRVKDIPDITKYLPPRGTSA